MKPQSKNIQLLSYLSNLFNLHGLCTNREGKTFESWVQNNGEIIMEYFYSTIQTLARKASVMSVSRITFEPAVSHITKLSNYKGEPAQHIWFLFRIWGFHGGDYDWDVAQCKFIINGRFRGACRFHLQSRRNNVREEKFLLPWRWWRHVLMKRQFIINPHGTILDFCLFIDVVSHLNCTHQKFHSTNRNILNSLNTSFSASSFLFQ
jgi:hypothetical protein